MRIFRFRAFRDKGGYVEFGIGDILFISLEVGKIFVGTDLLKLETFSQFTGVLDRNNIKIYEGDIVEAEDEMNGVKFVGSIGYYDKFGWFAVQIGGDYEKHLNFTDIKNTKVIGNIYENIYLLEEK